MMKDPNEITHSMEEVIRFTLREDVGRGDVTTDAIIPADSSLHGHVIAKQEGVISGLEVAACVYALIDPEIHCERTAKDGQSVKTGCELLILTGPARSLLTGERTALNFLGRMSGISTLTRQYVEAVAGTKAKILDTRKTAPGLRAFDKMAVRAGGGSNHRIGLYDMILIKDNHIDFAGSLENAVIRAREATSSLEIEVETRTLEDVHIALELGVKRILLDNMSCDMMREAVGITKGQALLEASGNITIHNVRQVAETGVDFISIGALTHSVKVFDVSFDYLDKPARMR